MSKYISTREAAEELGCSPSTVRRLIEEGELKGRRLTSGGPYQILEKDLEAFLKEIEDGTRRSPEADEAYQEGYDAGVQDASCDRDEDDDDEDLDDEDLDDDA
jgi:excisionase family DNA binding protein